MTLESMLGYGAVLCSAVVQPQNNGHSHSRLWPSITQIYPPTKYPSVLMLVLYFVLFFLFFFFFFLFYLFYLSNVSENTLSSASRTSVRTWVRSCRCAGGVFSEH